MSAKQLNEHNAVARALSQKWGYLLEGIKSEQIRGTTAILLENESQRGSQLITEAGEAGTFSGQTAGSGSTFANMSGAGADIAPFQHYLLPLVRRVYPNLIANELVGVQPMTSPASLVFYLKYKYSGLVNPDTVDSNVVTPSKGAKGWTEADTEYGNFSGNTWAIDPYYSLQTIFREIWNGTFATPTATIAAVAVAGQATSAEVLATTPALPAAGATPLIPGTFSLGPIGSNLKFNLASPLGTAIATYTLASWTQATMKATFTYVGVTKTDGTAVTTAGTPTAQFELIFSATTGKPTSMTVAGAANPLVFTSIAIAGGADFVDDVVSWNTTSRRSYDYNMEGNRTLPEMELQVDSSPVAAKTRKLRTKWTIEAAQDLRAMHNIDAEQELIAVLANEVTAEIDREIINDLLVNAAIRVNYDYSSPFIVGGITGTGAMTTVGGVSQYVPGVPGSTYNFGGAMNFDDRNKALFYQILECAAQIYRQSLRGSGNWIVTSPEVGAKLESMVEFKPDAKSDTTFNMGIQYSGTLNGAFKVYKDPLFPRAKILVGYKGQSFMDAGYFYCPYVPLQLTPTVLDTESFNPRKGLITRYGKVLVENGARMYATISVANLSAIGSDGLPSFTGASPDPQKNSQVISAAVSGSDLI